MSQRPTLSEVTHNTTANLRKESPIVEPRPKVLISSSSDIHQSRQAAKVEIFLEQ